MKENKIIAVIVLVMAMLLIGSSISLGAYSVGNKTVNSEESFSITVTSDTALEAYNLDLVSYDGLQFTGCSKAEEGAIIEISNGSIGYMNMSGSTKTLGTYSFKAPTVTKDTTYTVKFSVDQSTTVTSTITVKAKVEEQPPEDPPIINPPIVVKSNNANLSNLGIRPNDFSGFKSDKTSYTVEVPNEVASIEIYANKGQEGQTISGTGTKSLTEGENHFAIEVTAEDGTKKTYSITVNRSTAVAKSNNANLSNLGIRPNDFSGFKPGNLTYSVTVPNEVDTIEVYASKAQDKQEISGTGKKTLEEGSNVFEVKVRAEDGTEKTYRITVVRLAKEETNEPEKPEETKVALASLEIDNVTLNEAFHPETYEYTAKANEQAEKVVVKATANVGTAKIQVSGAEEYEVGENTIRITVTSEDGTDSKTYVITVTKEEVSTEPSEDENTIPVVAGVTTDNNGGNGSNSIEAEKLVFCVGIGVVALLGVLFAFIRYRKDQDTVKEINEIDFVGDISATEAIKDAAIATAKLAGTETELAEETEVTKKRGKHF